MNPYLRCQGYPDRCVSGCPAYIPDQLYFCRKWNRHKFGSDIVEVEVQARKQKKNWWERNKEMTAA